MIESKWNEKHLRELLPHLWCFTYCALDDKQNWLRYWPNAYST